MLQDLRYGARMLAKSRGVTVVALLSLALGIGANSAIFAVVDSFLWRPLPIQEADRVVAVFTTDPKNRGLLPISTLNYEDFRDKNDVFTGLAASGFATMDLTVAGETTRIFGFMVSGNYFEVLGVPMARGRGFRPEEARALGGEPVVVLSYRLWRTQFGGDPGLVGKTVAINRIPFTVVGITDEKFTGTFTGFNPAAWVPYTMRNRINPGFLWFTESRRGVWLNVNGRLPPGVGREQAGAAMKTLARHLEQAYPEANEGRSVELTTLAEARANPLGAAQNPLPKMAGLLLVGVGLVLLIACANVGNLLLARATARRREIAVRISLGASRTRLLRQLLTESTLLALLAGAAGLLVALWATDVLNALQPPGAAQFGLNIGLDFRVLGFTLAVSLLTGLIFGFAPALQATKTDVHDYLKEGGRQVADRSRGGRLRHLLVVAQVALALVALAGAGLFARSLRKATTMDPGFQAENILTTNLDVSLHGYTPEAGARLYRRLLERTTALPGVIAATLTARLPLAFGLQRTVYLEGQVPSEKERGALVNVSTVEVGYFETLGIPILRGRAFTEQDDEDAPRVAVINEAMARRFWPNQDPLGKRFRLPAGRDGEFTPLMEVVGVARQSKYVTLGEDPTPFFYLPFRQDYSPGVFLVVRTGGDPSGLLSLLRQEVRALDAGLPLFNSQPLTEQVRGSLWLARIGAYLLAVFSLLGLSLATVGIYGVVSYTVSQSTHEIGVRMALGAQRGDILRMVLRRGMVLVGTGLALGLATALGVTRAVASLLFDVSPTDPLTLGAVLVLLAAVALLACYLPARRATRVDPLVALRYE